MKPLNNDDPTCNPISSNCVIWQGPDIECISLCKGDTVSIVVDKLAKELCKIMETLDVSEYDLSCLNLTNCAPEDFQALIQLLIQKICDLEQCCDEQTPVPANGCPDCEVQVASCFYFTNPLGDEVTSMQLQDYVTAIGNKICDLVSTGKTINSTLNDHSKRIATVEEKVTDLENETFTLPTIIPVCVMPAVPTDPIVVLQALEQQFCELRTATGEPNEIFGAIVADCLNGTPPKALSTTGNISGWTVMQNMADAMANMFLLICDIRAAVSTIQINCCPTGCDGISIQLQAVVDGTNLILYFTGTIPAGFSYCGGILPSMKVSDTGGAFFYQPIDIMGDLNVPGGTIISLSGTPVDPSSDLDLDIQPCFYNSTTNATCQYQICEHVANDATCPSIVFSSGSTTIDYSFNWIGGTASLVMELFDVTGTSLLTSNTHPVTGNASIMGTFSTLTPGTSYRIRLKILPAGETEYTICNWNTVTTIPPVCPPPANVNALIVIT